MASQTQNKFSFRQLVEADCMQLKQMMPPNVALDICIENLKSEAVPGSEIFKCCHRKVLRSYESEELDDDQVLAVFELFLCYIDKVISSLLANEDMRESDVTGLISFILEWQELLTWMKGKAANLKFFHFSLLIEFALRTLQKYFAFVMKRQRFELHKEKIKRIFNESQSMLNDVLSLISINQSRFVCHDGSYSELIVKLILCLCTVGELVAFVDIKATAETWKCISKLSSDNATQIKSSPLLCGETNWVRRPVKFLCNEIKRNVSNLYTTDIHTQPLEPLERVLKIAAFYLKLLGKFAADFEHAYFAGYEEFIESMATVFTPPDYIRGTKIDELIRKYLHEGFVTVLKFIYQSRSFAQTLLQKLTEDNKARMTFPVAMEALKTLLASENSDIVNSFIFCEDNDLLSEIFHKISTNESLFVREENYNKVVHIVSSLFVLNFENSKLVEALDRILVRGVLQATITSYTLASICMDILLVIGRFTSAQRRFEQLNFWLECYEKFQRYSNDQRVVHSKFLARCFYNILPDAYKTKVWNSQDEDRLETMLIVLGVGNVPNLEMKKQLNKKNCEEAFEIFEDFYNGLTVDEYYELVKRLRILNTNAAENRNLIKCAMGTVERMFEANVDLNKFELIVVEVVRLARRNVKAFEVVEIPDLLNAVKELPSEAVNVALVCLVRELQRSGIYGPNEHFLSLLRQASVGLVRVFSVAKTKQSLEPKEVLNRLEKQVELMSIGCSVQHKCREFPPRIPNKYPPTDPPAAKRLKLEEKDMHEEEVNPMIKCIAENVRKLKSSERESELSSSDIRMLKDIVISLESIVGKQTSS